MKRMFLVLLAIIATSGVAYAGFGVQEDASGEGEAGIINCSTNLDCANSSNVLTMTTSLTPSFTTVATTYYSTLPYYSRLTMIGSGAPAGSQLIRGGPASKNCGIAGDGTTVYICISDGTNWRAV